MGAWGHGPFDNDDAGDFAWEVEDSSDLSVVEGALGKISGKRSKTSANGWPR